MDALAAGHDAAVQMIDTSVGLTSKIHAVVDTNSLPVHLALTPGEAHDNRLCSVLMRNNAASALTMLPDIHLT